MFQTTNQDMFGGSAGNKHKSLSKVRLLVHGGDRENGLGFRKGDPSNPGGV